MTVLLVLLGGGVGAVLRHLVAQRLGRAGDGWRAFPWATFAVNMAGALLLGIVAGAAAANRVPHSVLVLTGTGFCGALTTFSTFSHESVRLAEGRRAAMAVAYVVVSVAVGLALCALGWRLAPTA